MDAQYAATMGYTQEELVQYFAEHVQAITQERNQQGQPSTEEEVLAEGLVQWISFLKSRDLCLQLLLDAELPR